MKLKFGISITFVLLALAGFICFGPKSHEAPITVKGNPSAQDLAEIKASARHEQLKSILPDHSWPSVRALPANLRYYFQSQVLSVEFNPGAGSAGVIIGKPGEPWHSEIFDIRKRANGWVLKFHFGVDD